MTADIQRHHITAVAFRLYEAHGGDFARGLRDALGRLLVLEGGAETDPTLTPLFESMMRGRAARASHPDGPDDADGEVWRLMESEEGDGFDDLLEAWRQEKAPRGTSTNRWASDTGQVIYSKTDPNLRKPRQKRQDAQGGAAAAQAAQTTPAGQDAASAAPGGKAKTTRAAPKSERPSVESLKNRLAEVMAGGDASGFAEELMKLTADQVRQVRDKLAGKVGKLKKDLVDNLVADAVRHAKAAKSAAAGPEPTPEPAAATDPAETPGTPEHFRNYLTKFPSTLRHDQQERVRAGYEKAHGVKVPDDWRTAKAGGGADAAGQAPVPDGPKEPAGRPQPAKPRPTPPINFGQVGLDDEGDEDAGPSLRRGRVRPDDEGDKERRIQAHAERVAREDPEAGGEPPRPGGGDAYDRVLSIHRRADDPSVATGEVDDALAGIDSLTGPQLEKLAQAVGSTHQRKKTKKQLADIVRHLVLANHTIHQRTEMAQ